MERRVDDLHIAVLAHALGRQRQRVHPLEVDLVELLVEDGDVLRILAREDHVHIGDLGHLLDDVLVVRRRHLRPVGPIGLIAVVLLGVVRCGDHHARLALEFADREAQLGRGAQCVEQIDREAVRGENIGHALGEQARIVAAVVPHGHADRLAREVLLQVVRKTLRRSAHRIDVHPVGTHAHDAAQTARTKLEVLVEALDELLHIVLHQIFDLFFGLVVIMTVQPGLRLFQHHPFQFVCHSFISFAYRSTLGCLKNFICKYTHIFSIIQYQRVKIWVLRTVVFP